VKSYPLILTAPLVRAALDGSKTQHRVPIKPQPAQVERWAAGMPTNMTDAKHTVLRGPDGRGWACCGPFRCPFGVPGDTLWVRETFAECGGQVVYRADNPDGYPGANFQPWRSPLAMPRHLSRLTLEVESVRVQRLQDISEEDARAEGFPWSDGNPGPFGPGQMVVEAKNEFRHYWYDKHGPKSWDANPWVFATTFKRVN